MSLLAQNQAHEQRLLALSQDQSKKRLARWLSGVLAAGAVFGVFAFYQARQQQQRTEMERQALQQEAQLLRGKISEQQQKIAQELGRHGQRNQALIEKLQADLRRLQASEPRSTRAQNSNQAGPSAPVPTRPLPGPKLENPEKKPEKSCSRGDPMCETL